MKTRSLVLAKGNSNFVFAYIEERGKDCFSFFPPKIQDVWFFPLPKLCMHLENLGHQVRSLDSDRGWEASVHLTSPFRNEN